MNEEKQRNGQKETLTENKLVGARREVVGGWVT